MGISGWFFYQGTITYQGEQIALKSQGDVNADYYNCRTICEEPQVDPFVVGFNATSSAEGEVYLTWGTILEGYGQLIIERSIDGQFFEMISVMDCEDIAIDPQVHQYIDQLPPIQSTVFYRMSIVNSRGIQSYSALKSVSFDGSITFNSVVYPNPTGDKIHIQMIPYQSETYEVVVWDLMGRMHMSQKTRFVEGLQSLDISKLPVGNYFLQITDQGGTTYHHIIGVER